MSDKRLTRPAGAALALAGTMALLTGGTAFAQGGQNDAKSPAGSGAVIVSGHSVHRVPSGTRSSGAAAGKKAAVNGHIRQRSGAA